MGYCPECGHRITAGALNCAYCGNRNFFMTMDKYLDHCDVCRGVAGKAGTVTCKACSGEGFREYRVLKDARTGVVYCDQFDPENTMNCLAGEAKT